MIFYEQAAQIFAVFCNITHMGRFFEFSKSIEIYFKFEWDVV